MRASLSQVWRANVERHGQFAQNIAGAHATGTCHNMQQVFLKPAAASQKALVKRMSGKRNGLPV
jgi:hypothetical protein